MNTKQLKELWKLVFGDPDSAIDTFFRTAYSPDRCRYLEENGQPVSALYWLDCEYTGGKLAYIYAVATHPDHRGKGLASKLINETHQLLKMQGYAGAVLKPAKGLFPFYERLGYATCGYINTFHAKAGDPLPLQELDTAAYARRRREFLPANSVIQEGATLDFLMTYAKVYDAGNALVCLYPDEQIIFEFLGDPAAASGILGMLQIPEAHFITAGTDIPYVMHYPLNCPEKPGYLGITLE